MQEGNDKEKRGNQVILPVLNPTILVALGNVVGIILLTVGSTYGNKHVAWIGVVVTFLSLLSGGLFLKEDSRVRLGLLIAAGFMLLAGAWWINLA